MPLCCPEITLRSSTMTGSVIALSACGGRVLAPNHRGGFYAAFPLACCAHSIGVAAAGRAVLTGCAAAIRRRLHVSRAGAARGSRWRAADRNPIAHTNPGPNRIRRRQRALPQPRRQRPARTLRYPPARRRPPRRRATHRVARPSTRPCASPRRHPTSTARTSPTGASRCCRQIVIASTTTTTASAAKASHRFYNHIADYWGPGTLTSQPLALCACAVASSVSTTLPRPREAQSQSRTRRRRTAEASGRTRGSSRRTAR